MTIENRPPCIADIMTVDLLYYDQSCHDDCYRFCEERDIDCLPVIGESSSFYRHNDEIGDMERRRLTADRRLNAHTPLFRPDLLDRFCRQHVMFIFDRGEMTGVVHFSDYNKSLVSAYLYTQIAAYEQSLRDLIEAHDLNHEDMLSYLEIRKKGSRGRFETLIKQKLQAPKFQVFGLRELIGFVESRDIIQLDDDVVELRNGVMHANRLIDRVDPNTDDLVYDFTTFEIFFNRVLTLLADSRRVHNRLNIAKEIKAASVGR